MTSCGICYEYLLLLYTFPNFLVLCHPSVVDWYSLRWLELLQKGGERWLCCTIFNYVTSVLAAAFLSLALPCLGHVNSDQECVILHARKICFVIMHNTAGCTDTLPGSLREKSAFPYYLY
jgi:hypothetical protein